MVGMVADTHALSDRLAVHSVADRHLIRFFLADLSLNKPMRAA